jgi:hypothetical protein
VRDAEVFGDVADYDGVFGWLGVLRLEHFQTSFFIFLRRANLLNSLQIYFYTILP